MIPENEYAPYYKSYIQLIESNEKSLLDNLKHSQLDFENTLRKISKEKGDFAYAEGKWTLKELVQHIIDTERVFCYRALCFARNDKTELPGFDENFFVDNSNVQNRDFYDMLDEMKALRISTIHLFESFSDEDLLKIGVGSGNKMSVRALGFIFSGHQTHHLNIVKERYL
ncbi:damage-inducible protein DinB [Polaribacter reichenbachii]|uniref:Damage-inducible protein DinB n=2 Tax=Polaribacter reichenbachii TaxID=996801 RepID=A0A1B8TQF1_9FLAO|nr:damage-inducible protein DinB [Polaribacter reichenbachii]AUC20404.1 damage-inducible protein DinB [Polaribacter reichenbachii]OBY61802.1 damage-inducible protein DinB [Polaribacter reichenbachii]